MRELFKLQETNIEEHSNLEIVTYSLSVAYYLTLPASRLQPYRFVVCCRKYPHIDTAIKKYLKEYENKHPGVEFRSATARMGNLATQLEDGEL